MIRTIDSITKTAALISAWMFFSIGMMVTYEVIMRKIFNAPTIWVDEVARFFQVWAVYLACAHILKERKFITVEIFASSLSERTLKFLEIISLAIICIFSLVATLYGFGVVFESIEIGRKTSTMLGVPKWITESAIPVGFGLLLVQTLVEYLKLFKGGKIGPAADHDI